MFQLIALFRQPADAAAFDKAYWDTHIPLAKKIPGVLSVEVSRIQPGKEGAGAYYQITTLNFSDKESFKVAMRSDANAEAGANLMTFARGIVDFVTAEKATV